VANGATIFVKDIGNVRDGSAVQQNVIWYGKRNRPLSGHGVDGRGFPDRRRAIQPGAARIAN